MKQSTATSIKGGRKTKKAATKGKRKTKKYLGKKRKVRNRRRTYKKRGGGDNPKLTNIKQEIDAGNIDELTKHFSFNPVNFVKGLRLNAKYIDDNDLLTYAATNGKLPAVKLFIEKKADLNKADINGGTPLNWASFKGHLDVVQALIAVDGVDVNKASDDGWSPILRASKEGHDDVVNAFVKAGADVNKLDDDGMTPISRAITNGHLEVLQALVAAGADMNKADNDGTTPISRAITNGRLKVAEALIAAGAKPTSEELKGVEAARAEELAVLKREQAEDSCEVECGDLTSGYSECVDGCLRSKY